MKILEKASSILASQTALFVLCAAILSRIFPDAFLWVKGGTQTFILGFIMLTMGMTLSTKEYKILLSRPMDTFIGACAQYLIMPFLAFGLVHAFDLPKGIAVGLLLVGTCPGGVSSNIMCFLAKGDVALSIGTTTASTLLSPFMTPLLMLWLSGEIVNVDAYGMFKSILVVTLLPVFGGSLMNFLFGEKHAYREGMKIMPALSVIALALIVGGVTAKHGAMFFHSGAAILAAIAIHNALGFTLGYWTAVFFKMKVPQRRAISLEVGCQNAGLATNLASTHFPMLPEAAIASAVACVYHSISGTILANIYAAYDKFKARKTHNGNHSCEACVK